MREIHHTSRCLGREFTFEEWTAYLKVHPDAGGEVVHSSPYGFEFNICDVCLNPRISVAFGNRYCHTEIRVAQSDNGRWSADYSTTIAYAYSGRPVPFVDSPKEGFPNEAAAVLHALADIRASTESAIADNERRMAQTHDDVVNSGMASAKTLRPVLKDFIRQIDDRRRELTFVQQTLF